ncbi:glycoside hydrolase family 16 protein [Aulographum hederae CBS 113979]|uniref:chitinase n=1 Tax=Aulographum hederae CBS 113979 TaxID=1176131 RepID=A0A6G1GSF2_9PEZI|nr:glycoside hydrolase family 16 protein [Aulographum hederae CBS 113979]
MVFSKAVALAGLLSAIVSPVLAQTFTDCNPTLRDNCPVMPALGTNATFEFNNTIANNNIWNTTAGAVTYTQAGAEFTIDREGISPTITSNFWMFFGRVSVVMKSAPGRGIVSSVVLQSQDLDEVDWEWLGADPGNVLTNYFGKGNQTTYDRGTTVALTDPSNQYHNYTYHWTKEALQWWIDDQMVRELKFGEALGGKNYPQTPCQLKVGVWPAGDKKNKEGVIEWAGGLVDYDGKYTMTVQSIYVEDFTTGAKEYSYGDRSGSWQSIKVVEGKSPTAEEVWAPKGVSGHWNNLPKGAQIGIIAGVLAVVAILLVLLTFCCIRQRRAGRAERAIADAEFEKDAQELQQYRAQNKAAMGVFGVGAHGQGGRF